MQLRVIFVFTLQILIEISISARKYSLKQVLVLSRHGLRRPIDENLADYTPKQWPYWKEKPAQLTQRGSKLEGFMGKFFAEWLIENKLLNQSCPDGNEVFVYANIEQRTVASAKAFVDNAFPKCNVTVHRNSDVTDSPFHPVIHNSSKVFRKIALKQMKELLASLDLEDRYRKIANILDYKGSELCKKSRMCDLTTGVNKIVNVKKGMRPDILGPLKICNSVMDAFVMQFYEGFPIESVAWETLRDFNERDWKTIIELRRGYHGVIFNTTLIAKDMSYPLVKYMTDIFKNESINSKLVVLMGQDANLYTVLNVMNFKPYSLKNQFEMTPIGSKIVFQKWFDEESERDLLKVDFVYQKTDQLRNCKELSLDDPPGFELLEINGCEINGEGFCLWSDFIKVLDNLYI